MANKITPQPPRVFTRDEPVTKVELTNCFYRGGKYVKRAVVEARGEIGLNAIKYLIKSGYATRFEEANVDYWQLTPDGEVWLTAGLRRWLEIHPEAASELVGQPSVTPPRRRRPAR